MTIDYYKLFGVKKPTREPLTSIDEVKERLFGKLFNLVDRRRYGVIAECFGWLLATHERLTADNARLMAEIEKLRKEDS